MKKKWKISFIKLFCCPFLLYIIENLSVVALNFWIIVNTRADIQHLSTQMEESSSSIFARCIFISIGFDKYGKKVMATYVEICYLNYFRQQVHVNGNNNSKKETNLHTNIAIDVSLCDENILFFIFFLLFGCWQKMKWFRWRIF